MALATFGAFAEHSFEVAVRPSAKRSCHGVHRDHPALQRRASMVRRFLRRPPTISAITGRSCLSRCRSFFLPASTNISGDSHEVLSSSAPAGCAAFVRRLPAFGPSRFDVSSGRDRSVDNRESLIRIPSLRFFAGLPLCSRKPSAADHASPVVVVAAMFRFPRFRGPHQPGRGLPPQQRS